MAASRMLPQRFKEERDKNWQESSMLNAGSLHGLVPLTRRI